MVSKEETQIRRFVSGQLRDCHDLSTLTVGILKGRYLACVGRESLTQEEKLLIKRVVGEELMMMQDGDEPVVNVIPKPHHNKRKREEETQEEKGRETEADGFRGKRPRRQSIERHGNGEVVENDCETGSEEEEEEEEEKSAKKQGHETKNMKKGQESSDSDSEENEKQVREKSPGGKENVDVKNKQTQGAKKSRKRRGNKSEGKRGEPSKSEAGRDPMQVVSIDSKSAGGNKTEEQKKRKQSIESDFSSESEEEKNVKKCGSGESSEERDEGQEEKNVKKRGSGESSEESDEGGEEKNVKKRGSGESSEENDEEKIDKKDESAPDSDSSSLPSLEDEQESEKAQPEKVKKKTMKKGHMKGEDGELKERSKGGMEKEATAVSRLKRYIALCGVRRNYKKLLGGCRSVRSSVAVLKKELEELGVEGQPSIEKCKKARLKREETQELADLDVSNIITTQGRPKRRGTSAWQQQQSPLPSYKRTVTSSSDSEDSHTGSRRKRATDWSNLQGIISDDADSD